MFNSLKNFFQDFPGGSVAGLCPPNAGGPGMIPDQQTRYHMPQLKILYASVEIRDASCQTETLCNQINNINIKANK